MRWVRLIAWLSLATGVSLAGCGRIGYEPIELDGLDATSGGTVADGSTTSDAADGGSGTIADGSTISDAADGGGGAIADGSTTSDAADGGGGAIADGSTTSDAADGGGGATDAGCPASCTCTTFGGHQYQFCSTAVAGTVAQPDCAAVGMRLARIDDQTENDWIRATANSLAITVEIYIGAEDPTGTSNWQWEDGAVFWIGADTGSAQNGLFTNWMTKKPTGTPVRTCGLMAGDGTWYDSGCGLVRPYVCEAY